MLPRSQGVSPIHAGIPHAVHVVGVSQFDELPLAPDAPSKPRSAGNCLLFCMVTANTRRLTFHSIFSPSHSLPTPRGRPACSRRPCAGPSSLTSACPPDDAWSSRHRPAPSGRAAALRGCAHACVLASCPSCRPRRASCPSPPNERRCSSPTRALRRGGCEGPWASAMCAARGFNRVAARE